MITGNQVYDDLMLKSPNLFDTVLNSSILKEDVLNNALLKEIMVANLQSAKRDSLMQKLDERLVPMSKDINDVLSAIPGSFTLSQAESGAHQDYNTYLSLLSQMTSGSYLCELWEGGQRKASAKFIIPGKGLFILFLFLLFINQPFSQTNWERLYGLPDRREKIYTVTRTYYNGFLYGILVQGQSPNQYGTWLLKTDLNGFPLWSNYYFNPAFSFIIAFIEEDENGDIIMTGDTHEFDIAGDPMIMRLNLCGEKIWCKYMHFPASNFCWRVKRPGIHPLLRALAGRPPSPARLQAGICLYPSNPILFYPAGSSGMMIQAIM